MNNKYVSLNRALDNSQISNIINNANSILDRNNVLKNITKSNFLKNPEQTRKQSSQNVNNEIQQPLINSSQPIIYIIQPPDNSTQEQYSEPMNYSYFDNSNYSNEINNDDNNYDNSDENNDENNDSIYNSSDNLDETLSDIDSSINFDSTSPYKLLNLNKTPIQSMQQTSSNKIPIQSVQKPINKNPFEFAQQTSSNKIPNQSIQQTSSNKIPIQSMQQSSSNKIPIQSMQQSSSTKIPIQSMQQSSSNKIPIQSMQQSSSNNIPKKTVIIKSLETPKSSTNNDFDDLKNNLLLIKKKLDDMPQSNNNTDVDCTQKIENVKIELLNKINKINDKNKNTKENYINNLFDILISNEILTKNEIINIKKKINNNEIDQDTVITYLENKKKLSKQIYFNKELGQQFSNVNYDYNNLLEGKWQVPMPRPPVCVSNEQIKVNQYDNYNSNFSTFK